MKQHKKALQRAAEAMGSQRKLATILGVKQQTLNGWIKRENEELPFRHALKIEELTRGLIKRWELRPDIYPPPHKKKIKDKD